MTTRVVYFVVDGKEEQAEFRTDDSGDDIRETFRAAAEAGPSDIIKLYNTKGNLVNISPKLAENTSETRYKLELIAAQCSDNRTNIATQLGFDLSAIEKSLLLYHEVFLISTRPTLRIEKLETTVFVDNGITPGIVEEMKQKVESFRVKLESVEHLSWLGLFKDISSGTSLQPFWDKRKSIRKSDDHNRRVLDKFRLLSTVQVTDEIREYLKKPTFDNWQWDDPEMMILLRQMFIDLELPTKFNIEIPVLNNWLYEVYKNYNLVPFHNFKHCFMVAQMMYGLTWLIGLMKLFDEIEVLTLLVSAICHDLDHPGYNNAYQINAKTELALRYNDISPLENHHCSVAFEILEKKDCNIFRNLPKDQYKRVREGMIRCILATDMAKHNEIQHNFRAVLSNFDFKSKDHRALCMMVVMKVSDISNEARPMDVAEPWLDCLLQEFFNQLLMILIKVADISNEARPMEVAEPWLECLLQEFFNQSDVEKLEGLPVAPFMDRDKVTKPSSQIGFIKFVLLPLFEALGDLFPVITEHVLVPVWKALEYYQDIQNAVEEEKKKKEASSSSNDISSKLNGHASNNSKEKTHT